MPASFRRLWKGQRKQPVSTNPCRDRKMLLWTRARSTCSTSLFDLPMWGPCESGGRSSCPQASIGPSPLRQPSTRHAVRCLHGSENHAHQCLGPILPKLRHCKVQGTCHRSLKPGSIPKEPETTKPVPEDEEWKLCPAQEPTSSATGSTSVATVSHRSKRASVGTTSGPMKADMTAEQRLDLLTKQAFLRRELTQLEQTLGEGKE